MDNKDAIKWGIHPPRFAGSQLFYRDLVVFAIQNDKIIGAEKFDYEGNSIPFPVLDIEFNPSKTHFYKDIQYPSKTLMAHVVRTTWLFNTKEEAFVQKVILLAHIQKYFYKKQIDDKRYFDTKIPQDIQSKVSLLQNKYPEVML